MEHKTGVATLDHFYPVNSYWATGINTDDISMIMLLLNPLSRFKNGRGGHFEYISGD